MPSLFVNHALSPTFSLPGIRETCEGGSLHLYAAHRAASAPCTGLNRTPGKTGQTQQQQQSVLHGTSVQRRAASGTERVGARLWTSQVEQHDISSCRPLELRVAYSPGLLDAQHVDRGSERRGARQCDLDSAAQPPHLICCFNAGVWGYRCWCRFLHQASLPA
jgi:hypothetical protein